MKRVKKILAGILATTMITLLLIGCSATKTIVVTINNEKISESLYRIYLWSAQQEFERTPGIWDMEIEGKKTEDIAKERALDSMKVSVGAKQKAKELGINLSKDEKANIKENSKMFIDKNGEVVKELKVKQKDVEEFFTYGVLINKVIERISESYMPNEEELAAEIESSKATYETVTVKHVLIATKDEGGQNLPEEQANAAKTLAQEILKKALAGESMAELAKKYSQDPGSKDNKGEYTFARGKMVPEFEEAAFTGEIGKVYPKLVETSYGYHIIKVESHTMGDKDQIKKDSQVRIKQMFANNELAEIGGAIKVEKTESYSTIHIIRK